MASRLLSPLWILAAAYALLIIIGGGLWGAGFFTANEYWRWGPPLNMMGKEVTSWTTFNLLLALTAVHKLMTSLISEVVYPYIITEIQDVKTTQLRYNRATSLLIVILHTIYSALDMLFILNGTFTQISFLVVMTSASLIAVTITNYSYLRRIPSVLPLTEV